MESIATWAGWIGTIIACLSGAGVMINKVVKMMIALQQPLKDISADVKGLKDDVARLSGDRLNAAYDHYVAQGWCPSAKKR